MEHELQTYLEGFLSEARISRFKEVLSRRTRHVTVVLEDIYQSQNASAVLRSAECMGLQDVHVIENNYRYHVNKQVVRGATKWINLHRHFGQANNTAACLTGLKSKGYRIAATLPGAGSQLLTEMDFSVPTAFVFGTEKLGVSNEALALCDTRVTIPMYGFTESYNVSVSVALCVFHFLTEAKKQNVNWQLSEADQAGLLHAWTKLAVKKSDLLAREFFTKHSGKI